MPGQYLYGLTLARLAELLDSFAGLRLGVVGDFFLDSYFDCDPGLSEQSLETGRECYQVVRTRRRAGAAGTVAANLRAIGAGQVDAVGFCGDDGEGFELRRALAGLGLTLDGFLTATSRVTPTYGKPCFLDSSTNGSGEVSEELERLDIKNRRTTPVALQEELMARVRRDLRSWHGALVIDQVSEPNCGVVTTRMRRFLATEARRHPQLTMLADSRERIGEFRNIVIKPNGREAARACGVAEESGAAESRRHAATLSRRSGRPVFLTRAAAGIIVADGSEIIEIPGIAVPGPVDPVGAGDSASAAILASLCAGSTLGEAATVANLVASVTIQQIGSTGTATRSQILRRFREARRGP